MNNINTEPQEQAMALTWISVQARDIFWTIGLAIAAVVAPALLAHAPQNQWITGTVVNAIIFIAAWRVGIANAILVAVFPSTIALLRGLLPTPMALLIPYIIASNILMIAVFSLLKKRLTASIVSASLVKFSFLYIISLIFAAKLSTVLIAMFQWPQLITALAGGLIAMGTIKIAAKKQ